MAWPPPGPQWPRLRGVLSQSTFSLPLLPLSLSGALTRHRPIRGRFVDSPGCSLGVVLISQRPYATSQTDEKPDKSTILPLLYTCTHSLSFSLSRALSFFLPISCSLPPPPFPHVASSFCLSLSLSPLPPRQGEQPRIVSTLLSRAQSPYQVSRTFARVRRTANKNDNFSWSSRNAYKCSASVLMGRVGRSW